MLRLWIVQVPQKFWPWQSSHTEWGLQWPSAWIMITSTVLLLYEKFRALSTHENVVHHTAVWTATAIQPNYDHWNHLATSCVVPEVFISNTVCVLFWHACSEHLSAQGLGSEQVCIVVQILKMGAGPSNTLRSSPTCEPQHVYLTHALVTMQGHVRHAEKSTPYWRPFILLKRP